MRHTNQRFACSEASIKKFIRFWLSIGPTQYWFHQTLTFPKPITASSIAKPILTKLFNSVFKEMEKTHQMAAVYILGKQRNGGIHFHIVFPIYGTPSEPPPVLTPILRKTIWKRWAKLNPGVNALANELNLWTKPHGLKYLLKHVKIGYTTKEKGKPIWHGSRNNGLLAMHKVAVSNLEVVEQFEKFCKYKNARRIIRQTRKRLVNPDINGKSDADSPAPMPSPAAH